MSVEEEKNKPIPSNEDIVLVMNIDTSCDDEDADGYNHSEYFQVKWSGYPHRIAPGQTRRMPRYLAKHYAKHLADHVLQKRALAESKPLGAYMRHAKIRPEVIDQILLGVEEYFYPETVVKDEGERVATQVESLNFQGGGATTNVGKVDDPLYGNLDEKVLSKKDMEKDVEAKPQHVSIKRGGGEDFAGDPASTIEKIATPQLPPQE